MTKRNNKQQRQKQHTTAVRRILENLQARYMPEIDVLSLGRLTETERREQMLGFINRNIRLFEAEFPTEKMHVSAQIFRIHSRYGENDPKEAKKQLKKIVSENEELAHSLAIELLQQEVWEVKEMKVIRSNAASLLNDNTVVSHLPAALRISVEWMRQTSRFGAEMRFGRKETIRTLFPDIKGELTLLNSQYVGFIMQCPYRDIAASMLRNAVIDLRKSITAPEPKADELLKAMEDEGQNYDLGYTDTEIYIMRIMAIMNTAITDHVLLEEWVDYREEGC